MGGILLYVIGIIFHWLYCKCLFFIGTFFFLSAQIHPPTLYLFWYYCVVAFPSVLGASVLKKPWHRWNANRPEMVAQNLWVRGREQVTEEPRGGGTPSPTGLQAPSQNFGLPYLCSHWNRCFFKRRVLNSQKAIFGSCKRPRICLNILCSYGTIMMINIMKSEWRRWFPQGNTHNMCMPLSTHSFPHTFQPNVKPEFL